MNATMNISIMTMSSKEAKAALEKRLKEELNAHESTEAAAKSNQKELEKLFGKKGPKRPRETIAEIDEQIAKLELERTIHSMSLAKEREILKQIHKLNIRKREVEEFDARDKKIKEKKSTVSELRERTKEQRANISELKTELTTVKTAVELGCEVKDLLGKKVECPTDKLGNVIGKKGKNVQNLRSTTNVNVDIERKQGGIRLIGTYDSLSAATSNLEKTIQQTEEMVEVPALTHMYLTSAKITVLQDLREKHPDIYFSISRGDKDIDANTNLRVRGVPKDIEVFKKDVLGLQLTETELQLSSKEAGLVVGKHGANITSLVERHQAAIDVQRPPKKDAQEDTSADAFIKVVILGPTENVSAARAAIEELIAGSKDHEASVSIDPNAKTVLLLNNGAGIQALHKRVNEATKKSFGGNETDIASVSYVAVNVCDGGVSVRGKAKVLDCAIQIVKEEVARLESMLVKIKVDPIAIPVMIGKSGAGVKNLKENTKTVSVEFDRKIGEVAICGLERDEVDKVVAAVEAVKADNRVERIRLECDEDKEARSFSAQFQNFLRSSAMKAARELVFLVADDELKEIVLRGKPDNVEKAKTIVQSFLTLNYTEELVVLSEDLTALLTGGKNSKIVDLAGSTEVNLSADRDRKVVIARGEKEKVKNALKEVREFLYGGADVAVKKITLENSEQMGIVIGKGGKTKAELQGKYASVSIIIHRAEAAITLRGPPKEVEDVHVEIMKLILSAIVSRSVDLSEEQMKEINRLRFSRDVTHQVPVQVIVSAEKSSITFRGSATDVQDAISLLKEQTHGVYEGRMRLCSPLFGKIKDTCRNPAHWDRIERQSGAKISLDENKDEIVICGKRECVKDAKRALLTFFDFLFGASMSKIEMHGLAAKSSIMAEVAANSGAQVLLDRDLGSILIFSPSPDTVQKATEMLKSKLPEDEKLVYVLQLEPSEDWLVSSIIGKKGASIKKLRTETKCAIEVASKERRVTVSSDDAELVGKAKEILQKLVETARKECVFIDVPEKDLPAFIGRSGANIREFSEKYGVELQIMKSLTGKVRLTGEEDRVAAALSGAKQWLTAREEAQKDATAQENKRLRADQIPAIIGSKGSVIRGLQKQFGCKIDIDRKTSVVTVSGGSKEKRAALFEKIDKIISEEQDTPEGAPEEADQSEADATAEKAAEDKPTKKTETSKKEDSEIGGSMKQESVITEHAMKEAESETRDEAHPDDVETKKISPRSVEEVGSSLSSPVVDDVPKKPLSTEKPTTESEAAASEAKESSEVAFVGDVIEACDEKSKNFLEQT